MKKKNMPLNLQFFAEGGDSEGNDNSGNEGNEGKDGGENNDQTKGNSGEKTFTQAEVSAMMAKEKNEGKRSVLKSLGYKSEEDVKNALDEYNKYLESKKTEDEKTKEKLDKANTDKKEAIDRATVAESKLACFEAGVNKEYIDDVMAIALTKVTDDKDLSTVIKEMKEDKKYESFFVEGSSSGSKGTGGNPGHSSSGDGGKDGGLGKRLAEKQMQNKQQKSSFFDD